MSLAHWPASVPAEPPAWSVPPLPVAMARGFLGRCPACGQGRLFAGFLRVAPACSHCTAPLGQARADDAPPYFTIVVVGHIVIPLLVIVQGDYNPPTWLMTAIFLPLTVILALGLLRPIKGATVGVMLTMGLMKPAPAPG